MIFSDTIDYNVHMIFWSVFLIAIIYLIMRRIEEKSNEEFEDRSN